MVRVDEYLDEVEDVLFIDSLDRLCVTEEISLWKESNTFISAKKSLVSEKSNYEDFIDNKAYLSNIIFPSLTGIIKDPVTLIDFAS